MAQLDLKLIPVTPFQQNCSLLWDTESMEGVFVDPGGEPQKLMTDFPKSDPQALIDSIRTKLWPLGGDMRFVPGHGPMSTFGAERADNPFVGDRVIGMVGGNTSGVM